MAVLIASGLSTAYWISNRTPALGRASASREHSKNGEAYRNFREGKLALEIRTPANYKKALEYFERAIVLDPTYAAAYAGKADAKAMLYIHTSANDDITSARVAVRKALALDPDNVYAHTINCRILGTNDWLFQEAVTECRHAIELDPNDAEAHRELGFALNVLGRESEALAEMKTAIALSPT